MSIISYTAEFAGEIANRIRDGSLQVDGIMLRDTGGKIRYILRGFENLATDASQFPEALQSLQSAMTTQQILRAVSIAQNMATAASIQRIERQLEQIGQRLNHIDQRLVLVEIKSSLILDGMRSGPLNRLKGAKTAAIVAYRNSDATALTGAALSAEHAARDILDQAKHLVQREDGGLPAALHLPQELGDLVSSAVDAAEVASAILVALRQPDLAASLLKEMAIEIKQMRQRLAVCFADPEFLFRRTFLDATLDPLQIDTGRQLRDASNRLEWRQLLITLGVICSDPQRKELEIVSGQQEIGFQPVPEAFVVGA